MTIEVWADALTFAFFLFPECRKNTAGNGRKAIQPIAALRLILSFGHKNK
ncbi:MAG: hypothetical protein CSYNP_00237 [Syntrophus sp. SKADARSKE-3]|nr:hypothetical protein [Syntrophus sp. SKADARSKE-3]